MKTITFYSFVLLLTLLSPVLPGQNFHPLTANLVGIGQADFLDDGQCQASFSFVPDSLTSSPFYYHFKDLSSGNINSWYWDFGDGSLSNEQNPSHQYEEPGSFKVCLYVADENDTAACSDYVCQDLMTMDYYSLGGLVYAGEYPLNNPVMAGDTGIASLYRIVNEQIVFVEDNYFQEYGYYWFGYLIPGDYMVKVGLTQGSTHYNNYFTTYFGDDILWTKADLLNVDESLFEAEINLRPVQELAAGTGIIRGYVNFEQGHLFSMPPISQTSVILSDHDHTPLLFTHPNAAGYFEFSGIPFDSYFLTADATGKPASAVNITLSESSPLIEGINLTIFGSNANFIAEGFEKGLFLTRIYPNPVQDNLHISFYSGISAPVGIKIIDVTGKSYFSSTGKFETGINDVLIPVNSLPAGIYLIVLQTQGNYLPVTAKFVK
jgi:PKD repeat protein